MDKRLALFASRVAGGRRQLGEDGARDQLGVAANADRDRLGQADAVGVDVDLDHLGGLRPIVEAVAGQGREGIEPRAERQHDVGLGDQLHRRLRAVVAERAGGETMAAGEAVVMLVVVGDRGVEPFGQRDHVGDGAAEHDAGARQDDRKFRLGKQPRRFGDRFGAAGRALEFDDRRQFDIDDMGEEIARDVDLRRRRQALRALDDAIENLRDARRIADFLLIADHVAEQRHLLDFLEAALADRLVGGLRRHQQHRRVVPVGGLHRGDEIGHAGPVLGDQHADRPGRAGVAVAHDPAVALVGDVPELDPGAIEQVGNRHEGRADDAEGVRDAVSLQHFHEGFFGGHPHRSGFLWLIRACASAARIDIIIFSP